MLVERIAALSDKAALAELDARYGMTLYAIAYSVALDSDAADVAVATALQEAWCQAASFRERRVSARSWLGDLTRRAARQSLKAARAAQAASRGGLAAVGQPVTAPALVPSLP